MPIERDAFFSMLGIARRAGALTLGHIDAFEAERRAAGCEAETVSPKLLPDYARRTKEERG